MNNSPTTLTGNIVRDPEVTTLPSGATKLSFSVAVNHSYKSAKQDDWVEETSFFNVIAWRSVAENSASLLEKGLGVTVTGRMTQRSYETNDGDTRYVVELIADNIAISTRSIESFSRKTSQNREPATVGASEAPF